MPRSGPGTYTLPSTYLAVDGELATAAQHNDPLEDLQTDANTVRPIVAGGTGASTAPLAVAALGALADAANVITGALSGLVLTNDAGDATNDIAIAAGWARDSADVNSMVLATGLTKRLDATWVVGTNQGGLDTGTVANATYYVYLIRRTDTNVVDVLFSISATAPTMPTNYTLKRQIGWFARAAGANLTIMNAPLGAVGEVISASVASGSAVTLTTNVAKTVTSISLTAGDWDVYGQVGFFPGTTTNVVQTAQSISQTTDTNDTTEGLYASSYLVGGQVVGLTATRLVLSPLAARVTLAATTVFYLVAFSNFTVAGNTAYGKIWARRAR